MDSAPTLRRGLLAPVDLMAAADVLMAQNERIKCALRDVFGTLDNDQDVRLGARPKVPFLNGCKFCSSIDDESLRALRSSEESDTSVVNSVIDRVNASVEQSRHLSESQYESSYSADSAPVHPIIARFQQSFDSECEKFVRRCLASSNDQIDNSGVVNETGTQSATDFQPIREKIRDDKRLSADSNVGSGKIREHTSSQVDLLTGLNQVKATSAGSAIRFANANASSRLGWSVRTEIHNPPPFTRLEAVLKAQAYKCPSCGAIFSNLSSTEQLRAIAQRYCEYSNAFFCATCFGSQRAYLPARILRLNDYRAIGVSRAAFHAISAQFNTPQFSVIDIERTFENPIRERVKQFSELHSARIRLFFLLSYVANCTAAAKSTKTSSKADEHNELYTLLNDKVRVPAHFHLQNLDAIRRVRYRDLELFTDDPDSFSTRSSAMEDSSAATAVFMQPEAPGVLIRTTLQLADESLLYSIGDMVAAKYDELLANVQKLVTLCVAHVTRNCYLCKLKGYICEACHSNEVLFPFNVPAVQQCAVCHSCFHSACVEKLVREGSRCPRCQRLERRASIQRAHTVQPSANGDEDADADTINISVHRQQSNAELDGSATIN